MTRPCKSKKYEMKERVTAPFDKKKNVISGRVNLSDAEFIAILRQLNANLFAGKHPKNWRELAAKLEMTEDRLRHLLYDRAGMDAAEKGRIIAACQPEGQKA